MNKLLTSMVANFSPRFAPSAPAAPLTAWPVAGSGADAASIQPHAATLGSRIMQVLRRPSAASLQDDGTLNDWMVHTQAAHEAELRYASILASSKIV
jgi:hypothetical protein